MTKSQRDYIVHLLERLGRLDRQPWVRLAERDLHAVLERLGWDAEEMAEMPRTLDSLTVKQAGVLIDALKTEV